METGKTIVLLNLENLYESLYDALNQVTALVESYVLHFNILIVVPVPFAGRWSTFMT